ncbi:MAG: hypothetical protein A3H98_11890 [Bacteroidetes bacterium RIFCSPLOWO2_02_FULL_36_8]|nr:MAG: hypothetical protein A3H98_11890 [Bacteroidetes bacterium RIFCSPLOWO2_02_FULL_36_8]OFY69583.1 MAG: hypothetical protein A3G23_11140 [Bacteroidetes bacterium RIFCSPLOWO2_12_FULL_37_12]
MLRDFTFVLIVIFLFVFDMSCLSKITDNNKEGELTVSDNRIESPSIEGVNYSEDIKEKKKPASLEALAYISYIENKINGLLKDTTAGEITFSLQYKPLAYIALKNLRKLKPTRKEMDDEVNKMNELQYFNFKIAMDDATQLKTKLQEHENYFNFYMQNDLKLVEASDTLKCLLFHFERNYNVAPYVTFVLGFQLSEKEGEAVGKKNNTYSYSDKKFLFDAKKLDSSMIELSIRGKDINSVPEIILN